MKPRDRRLLKELDNMKKLVEHSSFFHFEATPRAKPEEYRVTYTCLGLIALPQWGAQPVPENWRQQHQNYRWVGNSHVARIYIPAAYPRVPPVVRFDTPVFHPNLKYMSEEALRERLADRIGEENVEVALERNPELAAKLREHQSTLICLDGIKAPEDGGLYHPSLTLYDICVELGRMIMFQRYNLDDPLDIDAMRWTRTAESLKGLLLPIDNREFLDKKPIQPEPGEKVIGM